MPGTSPNKAKDANDSAFLGEFYNNSRLHHISTMGANFKKYVAGLREERGNNGEAALFPARKELRGRQLYKHGVFRENLFSDNFSKRI